MAQRAYQVGVFALFFYSLGSAILSLEYKLAKNVFQLHPRLKVSLCIDLARQDATSVATKEKNLLSRFWTYTRHMCRGPCHIARLPHGLISQWATK